MQPRRLTSFRKGDRAEKLGAFLLQSFCAIAEVPRQEDFGLVDAVATLLRQQERFLIAEDSFLVQFKSRTQKTVEFLDGRFKALMAQDLPLLVGRVDLRSKSLELHDLSIALAHPNINDCSGIVVHLQGKGVGGLKEEVLHVLLNKPVLRITSGDTDCDKFTRKAYEVLKEWLNLDRWNRRYRRSGITRQTTWETNELPLSDGWAYMLTPSRAKDALEDFVPYVGLLTIHAVLNAELRAPALGIIAWLRNHGVESDPGGYWTGFIDHAEARDLLRKSMDAHADADFAYTFRVVSAGEDYLDFWILSRNKEGGIEGKRHGGDLATIRGKGFVASITVVGSEAQIKLGVSEEWLSSRRLEPMKPSQVSISSALSGQLVDIFFLRRMSQSEAHAADKGTA